MAGGFTKDGAVQEQIDATVTDAIERIRNELPQGVSLKNCLKCNMKIPNARRKTIPGVKLCVKCQSENDKNTKIYSGYNRRGSKDSQLR